MNIPEEAVEAAARALFMRGGHAGEFDGHPVRPMYMNQAHAALEAAAPLLMAQAWEEGMNLAWDLAAETEPRPGHSWRVDWMNRMEHEVERNPYRKEQS